jgi:hypothetical protein
MYNQDECNKAGAKSQLAYERAKSACISAWGQGVRKEPLHGSALRFAELCDVLPVSTNIVRKKYRRGLDRLPYEG